MKFLQKFLVSFLDLGFAWRKFHYARSNGLWQDTAKLLHSIRCRWYGAAKYICSHYYSWSLLDPWHNVTSLLPLFPVYWYLVELSLIFLWHRVLSFEQVLGSLHLSPWSSFSIPQEVKHCYPNSTTIVLYDQELSI